MDHMAPFGLRDGRLYAPADVPSGLACACVCPGCGAALIANHHTEPHFLMRSRACRRSLHRRHLIIGRCPDAERGAAAGYFSHCLMLST